MSFIMLLFAAFEFQSTEFEVHSVLAVSSMYVYYEGLEGCLSLCIVKFFFEPLNFAI